jgi:hypothetical protein
VVAATTGRTRAAACGHDGNERPEQREDEKASGLHHHAS